MQPVKPNVTMDNLLQHQSLALTLAANVSNGTPAAFDATAPLGIPTIFSQDNGDGIMVRVGPNQPALLPIPGVAWGAANTATTIQHNLNRIPIGYYVVRKYQACDVYDAGDNVGWSKTEIVLRNTVADADTVLYIF